MTSDPENAAEQPHGYAILISLAMREEAEVMASALRAEGIDAFTGNGLHVGADWHLTQALGGVQVMVPGARLEEAKAAIRARMREAAENSEEADDAPVERRDRWKLWLVVAFALGVPVMIVFVVQWLMVVMAGNPPEAVSEAAPEVAPTYFAAPDNLTEAEQRAVLRDYCREHETESVVSREGGVGYITPCADIFRLP